MTKAEERRAFLQAQSATQQPQINTAQSTPTLTKADQRRLQLQQPAVTQQPVQQPTIQPQYNHGTMAQQGHNQLEQKQANIANTVTKPMTNYLQNGGTISINDTASLAQLARERGVPEQQIQQATSANTLKLQHPELATDLSDRTKVDMAKDYFKTIGKGTVQGTAKVIDAGKMAVDFLTLNDTNNINVENLVKYANGEMTPETKLAFMKLEKNAKNRPNDVALQSLYKAIINGETFSEERAKEILENSQEFRHADFYNKWVQPSVDIYEQQKANNDLYYNEAGAGIINTMGDISSTVVPMVLAGQYVAPTTAFGVGGAITGENKMQQYMENGKDFSEAAKEVPLETAKAVAFTLVLQRMSPFLTSGIAQDTPFLAKAGRAFINGTVVGATANTATQLMDFLKDDPNYDYIDWKHVDEGLKSGKYQSFDDYLNSDDYVKDIAKNRASQLAISSLIMGGFNTVSQSINTQQVLKETAETQQYNPERDLKVLGLKKGATEQEITSAARKLIKQYHVGGNVAPENVAKYQEILEAKDRLINNQQVLTPTFMQRIKDWANSFKSQPQQPIVNTQSAQASDMALTPYTGNATQNVVPNVINTVTQNTQQLANVPQQPSNVDITSKNQYNMIENSTKGDESNASNEFARLQEQSRAELSNTSWSDRSKQVDANLRTRLARTFEQELRNRGYSDSNNDGILKLEAKGNEFDIYENVDAQTFHDIFEVARTYTENGELVDLHPVKTNEDFTGYEDTKNFLSSDGMQGFALTKDGDLISVFNADPEKKGFLRSINDYVRDNAKTLDCFMSDKQDLQKIYEKIFGFKTASVMDHNMEYDHDDIAKNHNNPKVAFMVNTDQPVETRYFTKDQYQEALDYRNSFLKNDNQDSTQITDTENPNEGSFSMSRNNEIVTTPEPTKPIENKTLSGKNLMPTNEELIKQETEKIAKSSAALRNPNRIDDFGEKIGGARKDISTPLIRKTKQVIPNYSVEPTKTIGDDGKEVENYSVKFKGKVLSDGFKTQQEAEDFINNFKNHVKKNAANVKERTQLTRDGKTRTVYEVTVTDPKSLKTRPTGKYFNTKEEAEEFSLALSMYISEHGKSLFRPTIQRVERYNPSANNSTKATGQEILDKFNFRAGEFGNWVNNAERQKFLNYGYDALSDLATAMEIAPQDISYGGKMAIAFGARGHGLTGAAAHFEPMKKVINMTRLKGAGSTAHEMGHGFDNYLARINGYDQDGMMSTTLRLKDLPKPVKQAFDHLIDTIKYSVSTDEAEIAKKNSIYEKARKEHLNYHISQYDKLFNGEATKYKKIKGEYQRVPIEVTPEQRKEYQRIRKTLEEGKLDSKRDYDLKNTGRDLKRIITYGDDLEKIKSMVKELTGRKADDDTIYWLYRYGQPAEQVKEIRSESAFSKAAKELDAFTGRADGYHSKIEEMLARSFETFINDELEKKGITSQYLVHSVYNENYALFNPYPAGEERKAINAAWRDLINTMKQEGYFHEAEEMIPLAEHDANRGYADETKPSKPRKITSTTATTRKPRNTSARLQKVSTDMQEESRPLPASPAKKEEKNLLPTTEQLKQFEQGKKQAEIDAISKGAKALRLEKEKPTPPVAEPPAKVPPTEPPSGTPPTEPPDNEPNDKIAELLKERPAKARMTKKEIAENAYKTLVNKGYFVDKLADTSGNQELKYKYDRMLSATNEGNYVVGEKQTDNKGNIIGKSVNEIWKPVEDANKVEEFSDYLLHKLNINRMSLENMDELIKAETEFSDFVKENPDISKLSPAQIKKIAEGTKKLEDGKVRKANPNWRDNITSNPNIKPTELQEKAKKYLELDRKVGVLENRRNKPVFGKTVTADDSRLKVAEYEKNNPEFKEWSKDINIFNKNQLQNMVDAGLTNEETQELLNNMYDNYIRIQREVGGDRPIVNQKGHLKVNSPIKKAKGGNQDILPLKDSMAQQAVEVKKAISRNLFGQELLDTIGGGEETPDYTEILKEGKNGEAPTFTVFKDGKPVTMKINKELYDALKPAERATWEDSVIAHGLQKGVVLQKTLLTSRNPIFALTNFVRDLQTAVVNSKDTGKMLGNYAKLVKYKLNDFISNKTGKPLSPQDEEMGRLWELYKANGGESNTYFDFDKGTNLERPKNLKGFLGNQIDRIFEINEIIEQLPRVAEFATTLQNGGTIDEAMYNAADVTVNFKRGGEFTKMLDRNGASFLNASVQGIDKQIRNFTNIKNGGKGWAKMVITCAMLGIAPQLVNHLLLHDDEDYQDLPDYIKDNYWLFKIGDNKFIRIPRGRDIPTFLGTLAQRTSRAIEGDDRAFDGIVDTFNNTLAPNNPADSNIGSPIKDVITNRSWNGSKIVSTTLENKVPSEQYDAKDTEFAKWLGKKLNYPPKKIDYLIDQYSGGIGDILIPLNTKYAEEGNPLSAKFSTDSINSNKQLSRFYDDKTELSQKKSSGIATDKEQYQYKYFYDVGEEISELNKKVKEIEMSDVKDKDKIKQVTELRDQINTLAREANKNVDKYGETANDYSDDIYEDIFDSELYKNARDKEEFEKKIRDKVSTDANTKAKEALGDKNGAFKLNTTIEELDDAGIPLADYYLSWYAANNLAQGSTYASRQKAIRDYTDLTPEQEETLFEIFNIQYKKGSK